MCQSLQTNCVEEDDVCESGCDCPVDMLYDGTQCVSTTMCNCRNPLNNDTVLEVIF